MIYTKEHLCKFVLMINPEELDYILEHPQRYYSEYGQPKINKKTGQRKLNKDGSPRDRIINPPCERLKLIQKRIVKYLGGLIQMPEYVYGGVKGRDNISNADKHKGKKYKFQTDFQDFYPFITSKMVCSMYRSHGFNLTISRIFTKLTTYKGHLPQGAPTSSIIANLVFCFSAPEIFAYAKGKGLTITTFVDDVTISSPSDFKNDTLQLLALLRERGFRISHEKTTYKSSKAEITGTKVGANYLTVTDKFRDKMCCKEGKTMSQINGEYNYKKRIEKLSPKF